MYKHAFDPVTGTHYQNGGLIPDNESPIASGFQWVDGPAPEGSKYYVVLGPLDQLEELITQGQIAMSEAPLPDDIQKEIFDLEVFVQNYYRRNAIHLIKAAIESFVIPPERQDVTQGQRTQVDALKAQMLAVFNAI